MLRQHTAQKLPSNRWRMRVVAQLMILDPPKNTEAILPGVIKRMRWGKMSRLVRTAVSVAGVLVFSAATAGADPIDSPVDSPIAPNPYPKDSLVLTSYTRVDPADFFIPGVYGVYFQSPTGANCGIWLRGSFGCAGPIPGAPPGTDHIGWFNGDTTVHYDPAIRIGFPNIQAQQVLSPRTYVNWNETTCVTMGDSSTYCYRGMFRFMITPTQTYLNG